MNIKFETYQNLSTKTEKEAYFQEAKMEYEAMTEQEQKVIRMAFRDNLIAIHDKLRAIDEEIKVMKNNF